MSLAETRVLPGPRGVPLLGSLPAMRRLGTLDFNLALWREYGPVSYARLGPLRTITLVEPEHLQQVLVREPDRYVKGLSHARLRAAIGGGILTLEGDPWKQRHAQVQPTYTPRNVTTFAEIMREEAATLVARWEGFARSGTTIDLNRELTSLTMQVIARAIFGMGLGPEYVEAIRALHGLLAYTSSSSTAMVDVPLAVPTARNRAVKRDKATVRDFITGIVRTRREEGLQDDLLSMLLSARDPQTGEGLTDAELHDEIVITAFAGHETTASLLTWAWFLLAGHPEQVEALEAELDAVLAGRSPTLDDVPALTRTRMVLDETLRLYSPVPILARDATEAGEIDGWPVDAGDMVVMLPYATHRLPDYWQDPLRFDPEHFAPQQVAQRPRSAYLPFGNGRRICLGKHFGLLESTVVMAEVAQRFRLTPAEPNDGAISYIGVARPSRPILMKVHARKN